MVSSFRVKKESSYNQRQEFALNIIRDSLVNFYLDKRDFQSLKNMLSSSNWRDFILSEPIPALVWVTEDVNGDHFIPKAEMEQLELIAQSSNILKGLSGDEYELEYHWILHNLIKEYLEHGDHHIVYP